MATSQDLVPTGQAYGNRQANVAAMQQAGLPLSSEGATGTPPTAPPGPGPVSPTTPGPGAEGPVSPLDLLSQYGPGDFPFVADTAANAPQVPSTDPRSVIGALEASAQSTFARAVLSRLRQR